MVQSVQVPFFYHNRCRTNMPDELLSLKWNKHNSTFLEVLAILRDQESFVDVTLACGGKLFPAHKFILSTCSDYFREMFKRNPCKHPIVYMKDVPARDLEALLDFMYRGEVDVVQENLASLMKTAEGLQVKGLAIADGNPMFRRETLPPPTPPPRPPPDPSMNPPAKRKRFCNDYLPITALNMFYNNIQQNHSTPEPTSPYDLSQKSSSSSSVSQSDIPANDRPNSASPVESSPVVMNNQSATLISDLSQQQQQPQASSCRASTPSSTYQNKENSIDEIKRSMPSPSPRTPQPSSSSSSSGTEHNGRDSQNSREEGGAMPGPSGVQSGPSDDDMITKEEIKVDDDDYASEWGGGADSVGGGSDAGNGEFTPSYSIPPHSDCSFSNISASLDPALDLSAKSRGEAVSRGGMLSPYNLASTPTPSTTGSSLLLPPRPLWPQDGNIAEEMLTCHICGKIFPKKRKSNLQVHLRTHTNERPFKCSTCGRGFKQKAHLEKHQEKSCHVMSEFVPYPFFPKAEFTP